MDAQIERHQPLITARLVFAPKTFPPPPIIAARMEFPAFSIPQYRERSSTPDTPGERSSTPKRYATPKRTSMPSRRDANPVRKRRPRGTSVTFENNMDSESSLSSLSDEDDEDSEGDREVSTSKIPKPPGEAGRPQSGGYNLQDKLDWNDRTYESVVVSLSKCFMKYSNRTFRLWCIKWQRAS